MIKQQTPESDAIRQTRLSQSYFVNGFEIFTIPFNKKMKGCSVAEGEYKFIFVNSKLPRAERTAIVKKLIAQRQNGQSND